MADFFTKNNRKKKTKNTDRIKWTKKNVPSIHSSLIFFYEMGEIKQWTQLEEQGSHFWYQSDLIVKTWRLMHPSMFHYFCVKKYHNQMCKISVLDSQILSCNQCLSMANMGTFEASKDVQCTEKEMKMYSGT